MKMEKYQIAHISVPVKSEIELLNKVYPNVTEHDRNSSQRYDQKNYQGLNHYQQWLCERAILAPKNVTIDSINSELLKRILGTCHTYKSIDSVIDESQVVEYPVELLNSLNPSGYHNINYI